MKQTRILKILLFVWLAGMILAAFLYVPADRALGEAGRVIIFHVPVAWVTVLAFLVSCVYSVLYLRRRQPGDDLRAASSAALGLVVCDSGDGDRLHLRADHMGIVLELGSP